MPDRSNSKRTKKEPKSSWPIVTISEWCLRALTLALIFSLPWYYGSVSWQIQYYIAILSIVLAGLAGLHCILCWLSKSRDIGIPWLTWGLMFVATFAWIQSIPIFPWTQTALAPPSVQVQKWALGIAKPPATVEKGLLISTDSISNRSEASSSVEKTSSLEELCDLKDIPQSNKVLAWSIEPLHTRGAVPALLLCGLLVWIGRMVFADSQSQLWLFLTLTILGVLIACVGLRGAISWQSVNFLGLKTGGSFATFVSKNSAGGFFNICIAGCLGVIGWTLLNTQRNRTDVRYRFQDTNPLQKLRGSIEDLLADLNTAQIATMICLVVISAALIISLCRGAAVSALGALIVSVLLANQRKQGRWVLLVIVGIAVIVAVCVFQFDTEVSSRFEDLTELDLEEESRKGRAYIWSVALKAMACYGLFGSGLGTFHYAYLPFQNPSSQGWFYHAESLYLQCGVELGWIGLAAALLSILGLFLGLQKSIPEDNWKLAFPAKLAGCYLLFSQALHSIVDFAMILPALFVPAMVLAGSVQGSLNIARKAPSKKRSRSSLSSSASSSKDVTSRQVPWLRYGLLGLGLSATMSIAFFSSLTSLRSLAAAEQMSSWVKLDEKKLLQDQNTNRTRELAKIWGAAELEVGSNSLAALELADGIVFDYRMNQMLVSPPTGSWTQPWANTSPIFLRLALEQEQNLQSRQKIIQAVGGEEAVERLKSAAQLYAIGQTQSPLSPRLSWGRFYSNMQCGKENMLRLLPIVSQLARHNSQHLLSTSILYDDQLTPEIQDKLLQQAMQSHIGATLNAARFISLKAQDGKVAIQSFPQRSEVLQSLATQVFVKERFPKTHRALWERAREVIDYSNMTHSRRELWLADASLALEDIGGEIGHLRQAIRFSPTDVKLLSRLAKRLLDSEDLQGGKTIIEQLKRLDPADPNVKALAARLSKMQAPK